MNDRVDCDVLICGLGPVGQLLALLLGDLGVDTIAVDEAYEPYDLPRAAVVDDEVLRIFQAAGVDREVLDDSQVQEAVSYVTGRGRAIEVFRPAPSLLGHPPLVSIHQPSLERTMVAALADQDSVEQLWGHRVEAIDRRAGHVTGWVRPAEGGQSFHVRGRFLVGCDGARSAVRNRLGVAFGGSTFVQRWLVVDTLVDRPVARVPHPHFVGDCARPIVTLPMSPGRHRWEWMLHPGEDQAPFLDAGRIDDLIAPWVTDERVAVERAVVYTFHARTAARWRAGRVMLAGDAAHVMPPFAGQGFSSGARDAANLAWKLDAVLLGAPERLLDSYEAERRPHVTSMQRLAVRWGGVVQTTNPAIGLIRDAAIEVLDRSGALAWLQGRLKPLATFGDGAFAKRPARLPWRRTVGSLFPQPGRLDDALGAGWSALSRDDRATTRLGGLGLAVADFLPPGVAEWLDVNESDWVILRPDRYVFAHGRSGDVGEAAHELHRHVGRGLRSERTQAVGPRQLSSLKGA